MIDEAQFQRIYREPKLGYRQKSFANLLRMGHCAPTVMQTLVDISAPDKQWLVRFSAGMPGGIGNTGFECGGFTSSLALLGVRHGLRRSTKACRLFSTRGTLSASVFGNATRPCFARRFGEMTAFRATASEPSCFRRNFSRRPRQIAAEMPFRRVSEDVTAGCTLIWPITISTALEPYSDN